ncbi:E3 ubiquitin-protein ligase listerin [Pleurostoma richardsiae]|uniref:E3 ubiquitin-protein ligase listerin n=1 Tax=Pleurostoma richardsiae TaxID=41990 RepID=A0AA38VTY2_9PEZI|nr:E3 ubiquitin-protein ligase listerin [Pleurostoma richardsiae]
MSRLQGKGRNASSKGFATPPRVAFGGFSTGATTSSLSYLSEPPDFSSISDANAVVSLKNLLKKDSTTKAKALEDLLAYTQAHPFEREGGVEEPVLEAWVQLYPRISIDNSRRVRELAHALQLELVKSARKRMEKRIPRVVGAWLAGTFDKDRVASRAASDGLSSFLNTEEKTTLFWKKCHAQILEYATEAIQETPDTLSDERSTTADDAEAKYYRVVGSSLSLVLGLLQRLSDEDIRKLEAEYDRFFNADAVWACATASDSFVRKGVFQLLWVSLDRRPDSIKSHLSRLSRIFTSEALKSSQTGSSIEFVRVLTKLTEKHPEIWGTKKPPLSRLQAFLERGSQGGSAKYWDALTSLLTVVPQETISFETASDVLRALRVGIANREEPRSHALDAWTCYISTVERFLGHVSPNESRVKLAQDNLYPLTEHYLFPADKSPWAAGGHLPVLSRSYFIASRPELAKSLEEEWKGLVQKFCTHMSNSMPEVSSTFHASQQGLSDSANRWFSLAAAIHQQVGQGASHNEPTLTDKASRKLLENAADLLPRRNYKPFGVAAVVEAALRRAPYMFRGGGQSALSSVFPTDSDDKMSLLVFSPSSSVLLACVNIMASTGDLAGLYMSSWKATVRCLLEHKDNPMAVDGITKLISHTSATGLARGDTDLQSYLRDLCIECARGERDSWDMFEACFTFDALTESMVREVTQTLTSDLEGSSASLASTLRAVEIIVERQPALISEDEDLNLALITKLLALTELSDSTVSARATAIRSVMDQKVGGQSSTTSIIQQNLEHARSSSLEVDTVVQQALAMWKADSIPLEQLFPSTNIWMSQLSTFLCQIPNPVLSLTSSLGGAFFLPRDDSSVANSRKPQRDRRGCSIPARMAMYTSKLLTSGVQLKSLPQKFQVEILYLLYLVTELASDQVTLLERDQLWASASAGDEASDVEDFISSTRSILHTIVMDFESWKAGDGSVLDGLIRIILQQTKHLTPTGLYSAKTLTDILQVLSEAHGLRPGDEEWITKSEVMKATPTTVLGAASILTGYGETLASSKVVVNLLNRLVSDVAGAGPNSEKTLATLVLLNACMSVYEVGELPVANNRLVFAVRQITSWFEEPDAVDSKLAAESCRALQRLMPCIKDVYGSYWEKTIEFCIHLWNRAVGDSVEERLPYIHASLKLMSALENLEEPNDDLGDVVTSSAESKSSALIELLKLPRDESSQPGEIVDALLCRQVEKIPLDHVSDLSDLYGLVASESRDIQTAAFSILHRALPAAQEQLSVDVLLEKKDARLPDELLSLLLDAPTLEAYPDDILANFPTAIRSYLLSWRLIFDAFSKASYKVRSDYSDSLKAANCVSPLMEFTFDVLGHSAAHPLNLDKEGFTIDYIRSYDVKLGDAEPQERNMHWLLVHLYYLSLKYVPGLFKGWYIECRSKQTKVAVEAWTTRYFSPIIISEALDEVAAWAESQEPPGEDEKELIVKISRAGKEVTAGYEVDELQASIAIRIPPNYPLEGVSVVGINRVAVNERKWQSWLMTTQGVITFSNGSIIDGLSAFRRNVVGALKGQSECAICYSIISTDRKMPDKRCQTCRNLFHRTCLYKWFQTSNQNTCPLCRNPIDYLGADTKARRGAAY